MGFLVAAIVALIHASRVDAAATCSTANYLNDCGYFGITEEECLDAGCCWDPEVPDGSPWCFYKNAGFKFCSDDDERIDCGYFGVGEDECLAGGCCWDEKPSEPFCFYPNSDARPRRSSFGDASHNEGVQILKEVRNAKNDAPSPKPPPEKSPKGPLEFYEETESREETFMKSESEGPEVGPVKIEEAAATKSKTKTEAAVVKGPPPSPTAPSAFACFVFLKEQCGEEGITKEKCHEKGCCWDNNPFHSEDPYCYHPDM